MTCDPDLCRRLGLEVRKKVEQCLDIRGNSGHYMDLFAAPAPIDAPTHTG